jgi:hypothetical protein
MRVVLVALFLARGSAHRMLACCDILLTTYRDLLQRQTSVWRARVLVYTEHADDSYVFSGAPTSFTGERPS